jgi:hypothetical protein
MLNITDKSFRYTDSYNTDLKKTFRKIELARRAAAASKSLSEVAKVATVVPIISRRNVQNP